MTRFGARVPRVHKAVRFEKDLLNKVKDQANLEGLSLPNMMENMFRHYLRIPQPDKPTKLGRFDEVG